jgi:hypothetical protein
LSLFLKVFIHPPSKCCTDEGLDLKSNT